MNEWQGKISIRKEMKNTGLDAMDTKKTVEKQKKALENSVPVWKPQSVKTHTRRNIS